MESYFRLNISLVWCFSISCYNLPDLIRVVYLLPLSEYSSALSFYT